jgi:hypothetical protein
MKKYKLIKEYPGSPCLGTICEERNNKSSFCYYFEGEKNMGITKDQVENQQEYWEEITHIYYLVFTKEETSFKTWQSYRTESCAYDTDYKKYFTSKEEAEEYILLNKPDISIKYLEDYYEFKLVELRKKIKNERAQDK